MPSSYRNDAQRPGDARAPGFGLDLDVAVVALVCSTVELAVQIAHGGAWGAQPTIALMIFVAATITVARTTCARIRRARAIPATGRGAGAGTEERLNG